MENDQPARVVSIGRNHVWIVFDDESEPRSAELRKTKSREMLVPGDRVRACLRPDGTAFVLEREPRGRILERKTPGGRTKIMAANIDMVLVAAAFERPTLNTAMVDELLAFAVLHELDAALVFSKADLVGEAEALAVAGIYRNIGYHVFIVDARNGTGVADVAAFLVGHETLVIGASGVGKSTLFSALGGTAAVGAVSERTGQGRQTTTSGRLHHFADGSLIDSPGIGEFSLEGIEENEVIQLWRELEPFPAHCRFIDCSHSSEPDCAVRTAVESGTLAPSRYASFQRARTRLAETRKTWPR